MNAVTSYAERMQPAERETWANHGARRGLSHQASITASPLRMGSKGSAFASYPSKVSAVPAPPIEPRMPRFFEQAEQLAHRGRTDAALDLIFDGVDALMRANDLGTLGLLMERADPAQFDLDLCIGLLSASLPVRNRLPVRGLLYQSLVRRLTELEEDPRQALVGLD